MGKKRRQPTFRELVGEPTWGERPSPTEGRYAVRPGSFNLAGELFDPDGGLLRLRERDVSARGAKKLVLRGALVAHEACGCGGAYGDCTPSWLSAARVETLKVAPPPTFVEAVEPTWIDVWRGEDRTIVVFCHGAVEWGGVELSELGTES